MMNMFERFESPMKDLAEVCQSVKESFHTATPFPHCFIDDLISDELLEEVLTEFCKRDKDRPTGQVVATSPNINLQVPPQIQIER